MAEIPSLVPLHCAFCLKHLPMDGAPTVACVRCSTPYCSADCRAKDKNEGCGMLWNDAELDGETDRYLRPAPTKHTRAVCSAIARVGVEQHYANVEATAEAKFVVRELAPQVARCARELDEQPTCYICLEGGDGLVRSCNCRGTGGFAHFACLVEYASSQSTETEFSHRWHTCRNCLSPFQGTLRLALARECWRLYCSLPEEDCGWRRLWALDTLVEPLMDQSFCHPEALRAAEAHLAMLQADFAHEDPEGDFTADARGLLSSVLVKVGRNAEALRLSEDVYAHMMSRHGADHRATLSAASSLSVILANCGFAARRRTLLRDAYQRAERAHGPDCGTTESLRFCLASSLWNCGDAPRENLVEAAELLETSAEFARQTYGAENEDTRFALDFRQRVLDAIEAFDTRPVKRLRTLRLRDVDRRAEVENSDPRRGVEQTRLSRASLRDSLAFFHCLRGTPLAHPDVP
jgi:hypothetical protein